MSEEAGTCRNRPTADGLCTYGYNGGYVIENRRTSGTCTSRYPVDLPPHVRIETAVTKLGGVHGSYWLAFGVPDSGSEGKYTFEINNVGKYKLSRRVGGRWQTLIPWKTSEALLPGESVTNRLAVEIRGRSLTFFVNEREVNNYTAETEVNGRVSLEVNGIKNGEAPLKVGFDYLHAIALP